MSSDYPTNTDESGNVEAARNSMKSQDNRRSSQAPRKTPKSGDGQNPGRASASSRGSSRMETPRPTLEDINNPSADMRNLRRIIAEDPEWNLATVPLLKELCLRELIRNFPFNCNILHALPDKQKDIVLKRIDVKLPLKVTAALIQDEDYWKRVCLSRWNVCDVSQYDGSWKRMLFERNLQSILENFIPGTTDDTRLTETLPLSAPYVRRLRIMQMMPPIKEDSKGDLASDNDSDAEESPSSDHLDLTLVLSQLYNLVELHVVYEVKDCGMNFDWSLFQFTYRDCLQLSKALADHKGLRSLHLTRSRVDDDKCRVLISHLLDHPSLEELDLSHNSIGDRGARAIGKFLNCHSPSLKSLNLSNNSIRALGAQAIAHALTKNTTLIHLNLRLNRIMDDGGQAVCKALLKNHTLQWISLSANDMSEPTASVLAQMVVENDTLSYLDLSNNRLGPDGGKQLQEGMEDNKTMLFMDLRFTDCGQEAEYCISQITERNQERKLLQQELETLELTENVRKVKMQRLRALNNSLVPFTASINVRG